MLSNSITQRALEIISNNSSIDILEAVKMAIQQENKMLSELIENRTERAQGLRTKMCKAVYASAHLKECFN
jgi:hypothetical protein